MTVFMAFSLTVAAGAATGIGALLPFFIPNTENNRILSICLGLSAGVMLHVSFTELFTESKEKFEIMVGSKALLYTSISFFVGIALCVLLDDIVHAIQGHDSHSPMPSSSPPDSREVRKTTLRQRNKKSVPDSTHDAADEAMALKRMSTLSAVAIALHNLPEGMATFFATMADPKLGATMAFAIAIHNIVH